MEEKRLHYLKKAERRKVAKILKDTLKDLGLMTAKRLILQAARMYSDDIDDFEQESDGAQVTRMNSKSIQNILRIV